MTERLYQRLAELTALDGVSGSEQSVVAYLAEALAGLSDEVDLDPFGNLVATRHGPSGGRRLMILAHSDEVGCIVREIRPDGMIGLLPMGLLSLRALPGSRVRIGRGAVPGVVGVPSGHLEGAAGAPAPDSALHIDVGAASESEVRDLGIQEGDPIAFDSPLRRLSGSRVTGKAIDNRIGCAILLELLERLRGEALPATLLAAVSVQEEIGMRGARMIGSRWQPSLAIALDTVPAEDAGSWTGPGRSGSVRLGAGPVVQMVEGVISAFTGTVHHPGVRRLILEASRRAQTPVQFSVSGHWTTDAAAVHVSGAGVPTGFISIPRRYSHSPVEVLDLRDAERAVDLLVEVVRTAGQADLHFLT